MPTLRPQNPFLKNFSKVGKEVKCLDRTSKVSLAEVGHFSEISILRNRKLPVLNIENEKKNEIPMTGFIGNEYLRKCNYNEDENYEEEIKGIRIESAVMGNLSPN
jgi:hypothetical protein